MEFEKDYIYIDKRESNQTIETFNDLMNKNTKKDKRGFPQIKNGILRLKITGNRYLEYKGSIETILPVGDYMFNKCVFELKKGFDLKDSVTGEIKRLDKQIDAAKRLLRTGQINQYYIFCTMDGGFTGDKFDEFNYFSSQPGIQVMQYYNLEKCFKAMFNVWNTTTRLSHLHPNYMPPWNPAVSLLYTLDSCTETIIKKIYNHFDIFYIDDLDKLSEENLQEIKGIGEIIAYNISSEIKRILHRPNNNLGNIIWDKGGVIVY